MTTRFTPLSAGRNKWTQRDGESATEFDARVIDGLTARYGRAVEVVMTKLRSIDFQFDSLAKVHARQMRRELVARHAFPYLVTYENYFPDRRPNLEVLATLIAGHTLALTQLDYHYDGSDPDASKLQTAVRVDHESASAYAVKMVMVAAAWSESTGKRLFTDVILPVSGFVIERMHEDWIERYTLPARHDLASLIDRYVNDHRSRLYSSGYWEVMCRGAFESEGAPYPAELDDFVKVLRLTRQLADEAEDVAEDLGAGVITFPTLIALSLPDGEVVRSTVLRAWDQGMNGRFSAARVAAERIMSEAVGARIEGLADQFRARLPRRDWGGYGSAGSGRPPLSLLLDLKFAVLDRALAAYGSEELRDVPVLVGEGLRENN